MTFFRLFRSGPCHTQRKPLGLNKLHRRFTAMHSENLEPVKMIPKAL